MTEYQKFRSFEFASNFEKFFVSILREKTVADCSYLSLPSSTCFTGCIKEILNCLKKERDGIINSENSNYLIANMYSWMSGDSLIKEYDFLFYTQLLKTLKSYTEGQKISKTEKYAFFEYINKSRIKKYRYNLYTKVIHFYENDICDEVCYKHIVAFINELLAVGINYLFLRFVYNCYLDKKFDNIKALIDYLFFGSDDAFDILIPVDNFSNEDKDIFEKKHQKIELVNNRYYCKVYANKAIDFFFLIRENIVRIESLFNILRFYHNSQIQFSQSEPIIIQSKYFNSVFNVYLSEILCYRSKYYGKKFLLGSMDALDAVKKSDKEHYHRLLNVISYAEKDQDFLNPSSYVDNWISLETLTSMSGRGKGFDAVNKLIPKMLCAKYLLDDMMQKFYIIKNALSIKGVHLVNLEDFIKKSHEEATFIEMIDDPYIKITAFILTKKLSTIGNFKKLFDSVERELNVDLLRIYILRNEYVHSSNLQAFSSMHAYKLKHILSASIDEFFRILSNRSTRDESDYGMVFDAFSEIINKCDVRASAFAALMEHKKYLNNSITVHTDFEEQNVSYETFVYNVLKSNTSLFRKYSNETP